jgi:hypothetical protein
MMWDVRGKDNTRSQELVLARPAKRDDRMRERSLQNFDLYDGGKPGQLIAEVQRHACRADSQHSQHGTDPVR